MQNNDLKQFFNNLKKDGVRIETEYHKTGDGKITIIHYEELKNGIRC